MNKVLVAAAIVLTLASHSARAQGRAGDAAIGAVSGAVVLGPVGAVAGAVIGWTAGPSIARSMGLRSSRRARAPGQPVRDARAAMPARGSDSSGRVAQNAPGAAPAQVVPPAATAKISPPPVQGLE